MILAFDIGGTTIKAAVASAPEAVTQIGRLTTPLNDFNAFVDAIGDLAAMANVADTTPISISITGVVDPVTGLATVANVPCTNGRNLAADLGQRLGRKVLVANDADCFALAEAHTGAGRGHRVVFGAILGTGVGGGIVADKRLFRGGGGLTGEWGHGTSLATKVSIAPYDLPHFACGCGQSGCVDTVGGARGIERLHRHVHDADVSSLDIIARWEEGEAAAVRTVSLYLELVARPLAQLVNIVGPDIVPVGGGLGNSHALVARLDSAVRARILRKLTRPLVVPAQLSVDAGIIGAASLGYSEGLA